MKPLALEAEVKKKTVCIEDLESAKSALDDVEASVRTGLRAGQPPEHANNENGVGNPWNTPVIQPLYGVVSDP